MNDFLKELFETYYKEKKRQDKIDLLTSEIDFIRMFLDGGYRLDMMHLNKMLREKEEELKNLKGEK